VIPVPRAAPRPPAPRRAATRARAPRIGAPPASPRSRSATPAPTRASTARALFVAAVLLAGAWVRVAGLGQRLPLADEIHTVDALRLHDLPHLLTHFGMRDVSLPIALWSWILMHTVGLEEWGFRALSFVPGILLLVGGLRGARRVTDPLGVAVLAVLLAGSPLLVFWSRQARPYAMIAWLAVAAIGAHARLAREPGARAFALAAAAQAALLWFSLTTVPFVLSLAAAAALFRWRASAGVPDRRARLRAALARAAPTAVAGLIALLLIGPALAASSGSLGAKLRWTPFPVETVPGSLRLLFGLGWAPPAEPWNALLVVPVALVLSGLARLPRSSHLRGPAALVALGSPVAYFCGPVPYLEDPQVFLRYQAACVPVLLLLAAHGLAGWARAASARLPRIAPAFSAAALAIPLTHALAGPLPRAADPGNPFGAMASGLFPPNDRLVVAWVETEEGKSAPFLLEPTPAAVRAACERTGARRVMRVRPGGDAPPPPGLRFATLVVLPGAPPPEPCLFLGDWFRPPSP